MNKQTLENAKIQKEGMVAKLVNEIEKLDKQIEAIENKPVSSLEVAEACYTAYGVSCEPSVFHISLVTEGEKNDRKRTQPLIDAVGRYRVTGTIEDLEELYRLYKSLDN
jgi:hypothetical protein